MKKEIKKIGLFTLVAIFAISCNRYENGGSKRRAEKNISKTWKIESYFLNGTDNTSQLLISNFEETFSENGTYSRSYIDGSGDNQSESGDWVLDEDKSLINISGTGSYELTNETSTVSTSDYTLLKLKKNEMWYSFENGGDEHEFHLIPKE